MIMNVSYSERGEIMAERADSGAHIVDCDVHPLIGSRAELYEFMPPTWRDYFDSRGMRTFARARDRYSHPNTTYRLDALPPNGGPPGSDVAYASADHLDTHQITTALLLPQEPYGVTASTQPGAADALCQAVNRLCLENWVATDPRYKLAVTVSAHEPEVAAAHIRELGESGSVVGVQLLLLDQMLGSAWFDPIYRAAVEFGLPIVSHQTGNEGCYYGSQTVAGGAPRSYGERHSVLGQIGAANVTDLLVNGTFERFPDLQVVMAEWGFSWLPPLLRRLDAAWQRDPQSMPAVKRRPSDYAQDHLTFTTQPMDEPFTRKQLASVLSDDMWKRMLLFSSDYPHYDTDNPTAVLRKIPPSVREDVCYRNAVRVFGTAIIANAA